MLLWKVIATECAIRCNTSATMDIKTVQGRFEHEGFSFLTITLTNFGKDLQKGLDQGFVDHGLFQGFSWQAGLPRLFGGFLDRVFDRASGRLLDCPCIDAIQSLRQLTLMFGKISLPCSDARERAAMLSYVECEKEVRIGDKGRSQSQVADFHRVSSLLFAGALSRADGDVYYGRCIPRHGPGSTADRLSGNGKYKQQVWTTRLEGILPCGESLLPNWRFASQLDSVDLLEPGSEIPVRVISVPKTLKTPRIIGIEPTCMQYAQQALLPSLLGGLSRYDYLESIIGFDDQMPNQRLASHGSRKGDLATLDLSEASDRVSNQLVRILLLNHPHLHKAVDASRSRKADVPGFGVLRLAKFASMGSALCFPFEAMVFTTLIFMGIEQKLNRPLTRHDFRRYMGKVRVYGDDIIVPVDCVSHVVDVLSSFGMKVNIDKSYWTGKFRESCGKEYYDGHDVSIVKVRTVLPTRREHVTEVISTVSLRNQLYFSGFWLTCQYLDDYITGILKHFPVVLPSSPVLGRHSFLGFATQRSCTKLHRPLVKGYVVSAVSPLDRLDDSGALLKYFIKRGTLPSIDGHLERAGRPHAVYIKLRWATSV